ncbi:E3 ubiquitin-protein ligase AIRP2 isoform X1 [Eucalyptus grandis]|uniref:E3 ubiquitin-protein ligase AIRP2 isoform X1 n=2 Tax=Eucalyptus grandis TaxID=71139 RepID=UPI00192E98A9|nr:E3 ubiquitin-protein ligase AIRP2 isoform X1 [Eucalyptus grandis]
MWQKRPFKSSFSDSVKALEVDIQHANSIAAALPRDNCGDRIQMRLSYSPFAQVFLFLMDWMDYSCTDTIPTHLGLLNVLVNKVCLDGMPRMSSKEAKASLREFYAVIYPLLKQLKGEFARIGGINRATPERIEGKGEFCNRELERDDECGICMESHANTVLPDCGHSMCISCYNNWNARSGSCPFCRGSLSGVTSADLWILMSKIDVVDAFTLAMENLSSFYLYIESLCVIIPAPHILLDYMI